MARDEVGTARILAAHRGVMSGHVARAGGRVVDAVGDNLLAEFPSVVTAVECAVEIQRELAERNAALPSQQRLRFRIGIHLGDVMVEGERIVGDGVNVAARIEGLAEPGGVAVSRPVHDQLSGKLALEFQDAGEHEVKNIPKPVRVYRLVTTAGATPPSSDEARSAPERGHPPIAVLPFANLGADPEQDHFADALADDLITRLSAWRWFPVIARNSSFTYRGKAVDVKQVGRELGARYVVEGSVRRGGERVRVTAQLVDASNGHQVWAERYDRPLRELFDLQDEVTESIVGALQPALRRAEAERARRSAPESLDAWALVNRAWVELQMNLGSRQAVEGAIQAARRALALDPNYSLAHALLALALSLRVSFRWSQDLEGETDQAFEAMRRAAERDPDDPSIHQIRGAMLGNFGRTAEAIRAFERSLELDPHHAPALAGRGIALLFARRPEEGLADVERAMRLSPRDPLTSSWLAFRAMACNVLGRHEEAARHARASVERSPSRTGWAMLALALGCLGRTEEARQAYREIERLPVGLILSDWKRSVALIARTPEDEKRLTAGMELASSA